MFINYLKHIWRNFVKNKQSSLINIIGLAIGLATFFLIGIFTFYELNYDKFHSNYEEIYAVNTNNIFDKTGTFQNCAPVGSWLKNKYPEIKNVVRLDTDFGGGESSILEYTDENQEKKIDVNDIIYAESSFFDIFSFKVLSGDARKALSEPYTIVLTRDIANKLFGNDDPVGKNVKFTSKVREFTTTFRVAAIVENQPALSSIKFNAIASFATRYAEYLNRGEDENRNLDDDWYNWGYPTYVALNKNVSLAAFEQKVNGDWGKIGSEKYKDADENSIEFVPLKEVPYYKNKKHQFVILMLTIGILVVVMAMVNFINISVAKSSTRAKEIGIKKVNGSSRSSLMRQFLFESISLSFFATVIAFIIVVLAGPVFESVTGWEISFKSLGYFNVVLILVLGILIVGITAGLYPALYLSSFNPARIIKNDVLKGQKGQTFRKSLIVFQFAVSVALIICTLVISKQINYLKTKDVGFNKSHIIYCRARKSIWGKYEAFKQKVLQNPNIYKIAASNTSLGEQFPMTNTSVINGKEKSFYTLTVDQDFVQTMGIQIIKGRDFSWDIKTDQYGAMIINETAVKEFELDEPIGTELDMFGAKVHIIGVMKDIQAGSFHQKIPPSALWVAPWNGTLNIRINSSNMGQTIAYIEKVWDEFSPENPFEYHFLDQKYDSLYKSEERFNVLISYFTVLAIFIACLGLFGLAAFTVAQRFKEIGVRKVNGAKTYEILKLLNSDFAKWVVVAFVIACPVAWYIMKEWLGSFAYKTEISWWIFALAGISIMFTVLFTVSWQSWKAARINPIKALRYE